MIFSSFNVNGIRPRLPILTDWLASVEPDVVCLQETKVQDKDFPAKALEAASYHVTFHGQKSYNGVAILSRSAPEDVRVGFADGAFADEARIISARFEGVRVVNTYVPQGQEVGSEKFEKKLQWLSGLSTELSELLVNEEDVAWLGDVNVARDDRDVYDPEAFADDVGCHPDERAALERLMAQGFTDVFREHVPEGDRYTFWDYRIPNGFKRNLGWRIDYVMASASLAQRCTRAWVETDPRGLERPSDHTPICAEFEV